MCNESELVGDITIGTRTVIHPRAKILAISGPIIIGENNIIEEQVQIINRYYSEMCHMKGFLFYFSCRSAEENQTTSQILLIGNNNVFEVDCKVESRTIGDNNIVESKGKLI